MVSFNVIPVFGLVKNMKVRGCVLSCPGEEGLDTSGMDLHGHSMDAGPSDVSTLFVEPAVASVSCNYVDVVAILLWICNVVFILDVDVHDDRDQGLRSVHAEVVHPQVLWTIQTHSM